MYVHGKGTIWLFIIHQSHFLHILDTANNQKPCVCEYNRWMDINFYFYFYTVVKCCAWGKINMSHYKTLMHLGTTKLSEITKKTLNTASFIHKKLRV